MPGPIARIVFIDHTAQLSGGELALQRLIRQLDRSRFHPIVILFEHGMLADALRADGVQVEVISGPRHILKTRRQNVTWRSMSRLNEVPGLLRFVFRLRRVLRELDASIVHTNSLKADLLGGLAARWAGIPVVWHIRDRISEDYLPASTTRFFRFAAKHVPDYVVANSSSTMATLGPGAADRVAPLWPPGPDGRPSAEPGVVRSGVERVAAEGPKTLRPIIGAVGRLAPWKGQDVLLRAAVKVLRHRPDARFRIVGSAMFGEHDYDASLRKMVEDLNLADAVEFVPFTKDVDAIYGSLGFLAHTSLTPEPFGQVVAEGMAAGLAVIATRAGGVVEIVRDGETGILTEPGDDEQLARAIIGLLDDPARALAMGEAARQHVEAHLKTSHSVGLLMGFYAGVLKLHPPPPAAPPPFTKALFVGHTAVSSGAELALLRLLRQVDRARCEPSVLLFEEGPLVGMLRAEGIRVDVVAATRGLIHVRKDSLTFMGILSPRNVFNTIRLCLSVSAFIGKASPDIVQTNSLKAHLIGGLAAKLARRPVIWYVHDRIAAPYLPRAAVALVRVASRLLPRYILANSRSTLATLPPRAVRKTLRDWPGASRGVAPAIIVPGVDSVADACADGRSEIVMMCGRLAPWKGQDIFLRAAATVLKSRPSTRFLILGSAMFGDQAYADGLLQLARELDIESHVDFVAHAPDPTTYYSKAAMLVHASTVPEPFGQVILEGMAAGLPVVASQDGGVLDLIAHAHTGLLVKPGDPAALANAILLVMDDHALARKLGTNAIKQATRLLTRNSAEALLAFYDSIATRRKS